MIISYRCKRKHRESKVQKSDICRVVIDKEEVWGKILSLCNSEYPNEIKHYIRGNSEYPFIECLNFIAKKGRQKMHIKWGGIGLKKIEQWI